MVSQMLFGEMAEVIGNHENWFQVRLHYDNYTGWIDKKQVAPVSDEEVKHLESSKTFLSSDLVQIAIWDENQICPIVIGSTLPNYKDGKFSIGKTHYSFEGNSIEISAPSPNKVLEFAYLYLNAPYLWGGRSPFGIDCSGFTQLVFKLCGIKILRDASQQAEQGITIEKLEESIPGDLAFFGHPEKKISHVGIILPGKMIIHASGKVKINRLDSKGIFNEDINDYSHNLRTIKRIS
jgi:cell wall-associated NlpC family hydrolase